MALKASNYFSSVEDVAVRRLTPVLKRIITKTPLRQVYDLTLLKGDTSLVCSFVSTAFKLYLTAICG
jgi:hypothetical protein